MDKEAILIESRVREMIHKHMGWERVKVDLWMTTPNPLLGNAEPLDLIRKGRGRKVIGFVEAAIAENKSSSEKSS
jgi:Protein of unknown function (DUF2384)